LSQAFLLQQSFDFSQHFFQQQSLSLIFWNKQHLDFLKQQSSSQTDALPQQSPELLLFT